MSIEDRSMDALKEVKSVDFSAMSALSAYRRVYSFSYKYLHGPGFSLVKITPVNIYLHLKLRFKTSKMIKPIDRLF